MTPPVSAAVVHFSGTGGARRVAKALEDALARRNLRVVGAAIDRSPSCVHAGDEASAVAACELLVLVFTIHAFDAPEPVYRWIAAGEGEGRPVAVISVSAGGEMWPNTGCRVGVVAALEARNYEVIYEKMMVMPCNWVVAESDDQIALLLRALPSKAELVVDSLLSGRRRRTKARIGAVRRWISTLEKRGARGFARRVEIAGNCDGCGWCARNCPEANIELVEGRPRLGNACVMCFRCVYGCPRHAMRAHDFQVIPSGFDLAAVERRTAGRSPLPPELSCRGLLWLGVRRYLDDSDGY